MIHKKPGALVVLSGGQDSTTCLFWAKQYFERIHAVTFNYGQRHIREIQAAIDVAKIAGVVSHEIVELGPILKGTSPLTNPGEELELYSDHDSMAAIIGDRVEKTFVPMRNALFLTLAANRATCLGINNLVTGVCQADNANYPDCREEFILAQEDAIAKALGTPFNIFAPLMDLSKAQSIDLARRMDQEVNTVWSKAFLALAFSHTAYDGQYPPIGKDHASVLRAHGFTEAGVPDPLVIRAARAGLMLVPGDRNYMDPSQNAGLADAIGHMASKYGVGAV